MWSPGLPKSIKAGRDEVTLSWEHYYPILRTLLPYWGTPVTLHEPTKWSADLGKSYPIIVGLLDVHTVGLYGTKRATDGAEEVQTSCNFDGIFLLPPSGSNIGTTWQHSMAVDLGGS